MKKRLITIILLAFVVVSFVFLMYKESANRSADVTGAASEAQAAHDSQVKKPVSSQNPEKDSTVDVGKDADQALQKTAQTSGNLKVVAYYFHTTHRCYSCLKIEEYSRDAIEQYFSNELSGGLLEFRSVDVQKPGNQHYISDYKLYTKSLVLSLQNSGRELKYKNLKDVWSYYRNKEKFFDYVAQEVGAFLKEAEGS